VSRADGGGRRIAIGLLDGQFRPLPAKDLTIVLAKPEAGIEPLRLSATRVDENNWQIDHALPPALGSWQVRIEILVSDFEKIVLEDRMELGDNPRWRSSP